LIGETLYPCPGHPVLLAASPKRSEPVTDELFAEGAERLDVVGHRVIVVVPGQDAGKPATLFWNWVMHPLPHLAFDGEQLGAHPFSVGQPRELEPPRLPPLPAHVREAEKLERLRLAKATCCAIPGGVPPELDQPCLLGMQFQTERREPVAKLCPEPLSVLPVLKPHHEVISPTQDDHVTVRVPASPLVSPKVKDVVRVNVREQRRCRSPI